MNSSHDDDNNHKKGRNEGRIGMRKWELRSEMGVAPGLSDHRPSLQKSMVLKYCKPCTIYDNTRTSRTIDWNMIAYNCSAQL